MLRTIILTITKPNIVFKTIHSNSESYLVCSIVLFAIICTASAFQSTVEWFQFGNDDANIFPGILLTYLQDLLSALLLNIVPIIVIFWIGNAFGKRQRFKDIFPVFVFCMVPILFVVFTSVIVFSALDMLYHADNNSVDFLVYDDHVNTSDVALPSYTFEFAGGVALHIVTIFFIVWMFGLFGVATKIVYGFGISKTFGVVILAVVTIFATSLAFAVLQILWLELWM